MRLDFSQYHPLDHPLSACWGYPGGWRAHLRYRWEFQWRELVAVWLLHLVGRHYWTGYVRHQPTTRATSFHVTCAGCDADPDDLTRARLIGNMRNDPGLLHVLSVLPEPDDED